MRGTSATKRHFKPAPCRRGTAAARRLCRAHAGTASAELAMVLAFVTMIVASGAVFVSDSLSDHFADISDRVDAATVTLPNPLGGGAIVVAGNLAGGSQGTGGGNANGNGGGNSNSFSGNIN